MLVGVLISIMISIVVGVSLIPTIIDSINTAKSTANAPAGLSGLLDVLAYVFVAVILLGAVAWMLKRSVSPLIQQCMLKISLIRGTLNQRWQDNPDLAEGFIPSGKSRDFTRDIQLCGVVG